MSTSTSGSPTFMFITYHHGPICPPTEDPRPEPVRLRWGALAVFTLRHGELRSNGKTVVYFPNPDPQQLLYFVPSEDAIPSQAKVEFEWQGAKRAMRIGGMLLVIALY